MNRVFDGEGEVGIRFFKFGVKYDKLEVVRYGDGFVFEMWLVGSKGLIGYVLF